MHFVVLTCLSATDPAHTRPFTAAGYMSLVSGQILPLPGWQSCRWVPWPCPQQRGAGAGAGEITRLLRTGLGG